MSLTLKLGRNPSPPDDRNLLMAKYTTALPTPPPEQNWLSKVAFPAGMMLNSSLGDCTCAGMGHAEQVWTANTATEITIPDADIEALYIKACGFDPNDPADTDNGGDLLHVAKYVKKYGVGGHKIDAYVTVDSANLTEVQTGIWLMGGLYTGVQMTAATMQATQQAAQAGQPIIWDVPADNGAIEGGHCIFVGSYDATGFNAISWGFNVRITRAWWEQYVEECLALLSPDWTAVDLAPCGFNADQLMADVRAL